MSANLIPTINILRAIAGIGKGMRRTIAAEMQLDLSDGVLADMFDEQIAHLRETGHICLHGRQMYKLTDRGYAALLPPVYVCIVKEPDGTIQCAVMTDSDAASELLLRFERVDIRAKKINVPINAVATLPPYLRPGGPAYVRPPMPAAVDGEANLHVYLTGVEDGRIIPVIKVIRQFTNKGIKEAKDVVDAQRDCGRVRISERLYTLSEANEIIRCLAEAGGKAEACTAQKSIRKWDVKLAVCPRSKIAEIRAILRRAAKLTEDHATSIIDGLLMSGKSTLIVSTDDEAMIEGLQVAINRCGGSVLIMPAADVQPISL